MTADRQHLQACKLTCIRDDRILFRNLDFSLTNHQVLLLEAKMAVAKPHY